MLQYQRTVLAQLQADYGGVAEDLCFKLCWGLPKSATSELVWV